MNCPECQIKTDVVDSRLVDSDRSCHIRRRRQCPECFRRFTTYELGEGEIEELYTIRRQVTRVKKSLREALEEIEYFIPAKQENTEQTDDQVQG